MLPVLAALGAMLQSCNDDSETVLPVSEPPTLSVQVADVQRTQATFEISSTDGVDYAYIVAEKNTMTIDDATEIFKNGTVGYLKDGKTSATTYDIHGGAEFEVFAAVRKINPYVYSEVYKADLNTDIPYNKIVTLDKVGLTEISYHVEVPAAAGTVKHVLVKEADYLAIKAILGTIGYIDEILYLKVFGHSVTQNIDIAEDKLAYTASGDEIHIHTGTTYYLLGGVVGEDGEIDSDSFEMIRFDTRKADEAPYDFDVNISTTSTTATVAIVPAPEFVEYRALVESKSEFDYALSEGEAQMRNLVVGNWDDSNNAVSRVKHGPTEILANGLIPNTEYVVGIIGYDELRREKFVRYDFITGEPTGPKPTVEITEIEPSVNAPWSSKAFNVKVTNTVDVYCGFFVKEQIDRLIFGGSSLADIVLMNGMKCGQEAVDQMLGAEGAEFEADNLQPETEYMFCVYARNEEYSVSCESFTFTTDEMPQVGGAVRKNMPGKYIASTTDEEGNTVTFPVVIATGADATTSADYSALNRLVAFGFGPAEQYPYVSPADLAAGGMSLTDAYEAYGPKWFIEFTSDTEIHVPSAQESYSSYSWSMGNIAEKTAYMWGFGIRPSTGRDMNRAETFPVEVSEDGNTIYVRGSYLETQNFYYYPTMIHPAASVWGSPTVLFRCYSELVLTRQESDAAAYVHKSDFRVPVRVTAKVGESSLKEGRSSVAEKFRQAGK